MKKILSLICAGMLMASCMNDWKAEAVDNGIVTATGIGEPTMTIQEIRSAYASVISKSEFSKVTTDEVVEGVVTANDLSGNIYQYIYIQPIGSDGMLDTSEGGIAVGIKGIGNLYTLFPVGQVVRVSLNGLYVGGYGQSPRIGFPYMNTNQVTRLGPMTLDMMKNHVEKIGKPRPELVQAREVTAAELTSKANITKLTPMLIVLKNAEIDDAGWPYAHWTAEEETYSETHDIIVNGTNVPKLLYTSTSSTFAGDTIKPGKKTIYGLLNRYSTSYQLSLRSIDDVIELESK